MTALSAETAGRTLSRRLVALALAGAALVVGLGGAADAAGRRAAVVVSNEAFGDRRLATARADGELMATTLREAAFDVLLVQNLRAAELDAVADTVSRHVAGSDLAVFYYTGVGSGAEGDVILTAVDAPAGGADRSPPGWSLARMVDALDAGAEATVVMLDGIPAPALAKDPGTRSVRPFARQPSITAGRARLLVSYSGATALPDAEGNPGGNSIFATVVANTLGEPGKGLQSALREVRRTVREATRGAQVPMSEGDAAFDVVLRPEAEVVAAAPETRPDLDLVLWSYIKDSAEPSDFGLFQQTFPGSALAERAAARTISLARGEAAGVGRLTRAGAGAASDPDAAPDLQSLAFGVAGDRSPPPQVRLWPTVLPATPDGLGTLATPCDLVAGDPDDPQRLSPGIRWGLVNLRVASRVCIGDLAKAPDNPRLLFQVGRLLDMGKRYEWAEAFYREAAARGYSAAFANLAYMSMTGRGRPVDMAAALPFLRKGAELGNPRCRTDLGFAYLQGLGVAASPAEGVLWLRLASSGGWPNSMDLLANMHLSGWGVEKDEAAAFELFQAAAFVGNTNAMTSLGHRHLDGRGAPKDTARARYWFEKAVAAGNAFAPLFLGQLYREGVGVKKDAARAFALVTLSAERGFGEARLRLGDMYDKGVGTRKDPIEAAFNYALTDLQSFEHPVMDQFVEEAKAKLDKAMARLKPGQQDEVRRRVEEHVRLNGPG
ncbi:caspase family protein [Chthonobacter rhizosphaerae]|uniref:caspase family protein n=1 Tax=Chthonobacter rhizosphaerae TaxID=2735553 RepID=UPI0015EFA693|nr:caspase family protein [Chthonobacter rhizosphaerae]